MIKFESFMVVAGSMVEVLMVIRWCGGVIMGVMLLVMVVSVSWSF